MRRTLSRIAYAVGLFILTILLLEIFQDKGGSQVTAVMAEPKLPVVTMRTSSGDLYNELHGYTQLQNAGAMHPPLSIAGEDRKIRFQVDPYGQHVTVLHVQVRSTTGSRLIEDTEIRSYKTDKNGKISLKVSCDYEMKGERGARIPADERLLKEFETLGFITELKIERDESVSFCFADEQIRYWLRDQGSVLEIYTWKACKDTGLLHAVRCSTIVEWDSAERGDKITNEIDVMAVKDTIPVFISCKTCMVDTAAINELAVLRDRYGGDAAKAFIISTENCRAITLRRAHALNIDVITLNDLRSGPLTEQIKALSLW